MMRERYAIALELAGAGLLISALVIGIGVVATAGVLLALFLIGGAQYIRPGR